MPETNSKCFCGSEMFNVRTEPLVYRNHIVCTSCKCERRITSPGYAADYVVNPPFTQECETAIFVNGRSVKVTGSAISFEDAVRLAFRNPTTFFTVMWSKTTGSGSLLPGTSISVENGMKLEVANTGQS
jgi:hypothetical protein